MKGHKVVVTYNRKRNRFTCKAARFTMDLGNVTLEGVRLRADGSITGTIVNYDFGSPEACYTDNFLDLPFFYQCTAIADGVWNDEELNEVDTSITYKEAQLFTYKKRYYARIDGLKTLQRPKQTFREKSTPKVDDPALQCLIDAVGGKYLPEKPKPLSKDCKRVLEQLSRLDETRMRCVKTQLGTVLQRGEAYVQLTEARTECLAMCAAIIAQSEDAEDDVSRMTHLFRIKYRSLNRRVNNALNLIMKGDMAKH